MQPRPAGKTNRREPGVPSRPGWHAEQSSFPGGNAEEYLRQSILTPNAYVVPGFPEGQMIQNFGKILTEEQIEDLIAFLMTMKEK